ncbi:DNA translocase FtsK [Ereboglobus luteus]|uniref:Cell division protein FtsK n=1 Tax=Ereboglobus luteus TaxID=1796921 RepID=A0A2U8E542_9BACT|nr:DNA translocase FtsK [Ereboglobus luteus]AWI09930.1 cell division protein FtsK [Ereboglobus luteus]
MASSASSNTNKKQSAAQAEQLGTARHPRHWVVFVVCIVAGVLASIALLDYAPHQSLQINDPVREHNLVGMLGAEGSYWTLTFLGLSTFYLPLFFFWMAFTSIRNARILALTRALAMVLCVVTFSSLATLFGELFGKSNPTDYFPSGPGGMLGKALYGDFLSEAIGPAGAGVVLVLLYAIGLMLIFTKDIFAELEKVAAMFAAWRARRAQIRAERAEIRRIAAEDRARAKARAKGGYDPAVTHTPFDLEGKTKDGAANGKARDDDTDAPPQPTATDAGGHADDDPPPVDDPEQPKLSPKIFRGTDSAATKPGALSIVKPEETKKAKNAAVPATEDNYQFPPLALLKEYPKSSDTDTDEEYANNMADLVRIIGEYGITVSPGEIHVGPVITCYEVVPAAGVRVEKIANLDKNIALHMKAQSVRILAPIPGKAAVGIEMPNKIPMPVGMRDILESEDWANSKAEIPIALGKDVSGRPLISDLTRMPHLLIAGATGSGKSVCVNSIIASIVFRKSPKDVRLIMVDPKVVELQVFNALPHMFIPVVTAPKRAPAALKWLLQEMAQRYQLFGKTGVRNITGFNNRKKHEAPAFPIDEKDDLLPNEEEQAKLEGVDPLDELEVPDHLPYIVVIMDELADLMMVAAAEVETSIARLAQLARAAGIHIIIATQRPSVNVITGLIKANLPSRIAFQVASQIDSRTILDGKGAESLIGRGDMLFTPPGTSRVVRAQGAFVSDEEVKGFVDYLKRFNGPPQYAQDVQDEIESAPIDGEDDNGKKDYSDMDDNELYNEALAVVKHTRRASTSALQRKLGIGYNRAARMMDMMEERGIVGPENGSKPREIIADLDSL